MSQRLIVICIKNMASWPRSMACVRGCLEIATVIVSADWQVQIMSGPKQTKTEVFAPELHFETC